MLDCLGAESGVHIGGGPDSEGMMLWDRCLQCGEAASGQKMMMLFPEKSKCE